MPFTRPSRDPATGTGNPRQQLNSVTSYLDLSQVYGSDPATASALRTHAGRPRGSEFESKNRSATFPGAVTIESAAGQLGGSGEEWVMAAKHENANSRAPGPGPAAGAFADDESRWQAVVRRDAAADGAFYYSVRTTGVYCRPSCPARLPRRENVRFHPTPGQARRAGYRPCKRCRPDEAPLAQRRRDAVARACRMIEADDETPALSDLADAAGMSLSHFHRVFKMFTGVTPKAYAAAQRARRVRDGLARGATVTEAIYGAGFNSNGRFYATAAGRLGMTPTAYRAGGDGAAIRFAVGECSLGSVLVAASDRGVCAIFLGDDPDALARELQDRFPRAKIVGGDAAFDRWVALVVGLVEEPAGGLDLPLDIRGTAFQVRVWEALRQISPGSTASYAEIAGRIGRPTAARAVARACATNPIAVAIPCHRVVRTDESLSGYRWGVERKAELLRREAAGGKGRRA